MLKHSFLGDGWAWVEPLAPCGKGKTGLEFITRQASSLLLYNGPMYEEDVTSTPDFLSVELVDGYPRVNVNLGNGPVTLVLNNPAQRLPPLNDGKWHTLEIFKDTAVTI